MSLLVLYHKTITGDYEHPSPQPIEGQNFLLLNVILVSVAQFSFSSHLKFPGFSNCHFTSDIVPLYVTWPIVSQICPLIYKWNEFNFLSITCFYLYVCLWRGHAHATAHMWWSKKNLKSVLSVYHVNSGDEVKLSVSEVGFYVPNHLRGPRIPYFLMR